MTSPAITRTEVVHIAWNVRLADYVQLTRPKIAIMVLVTAWLGMLGTGEHVDASVAAMMLIGTGLVTVSASAMNQIWERQTDSLMRRTQNRPLPSGRLRVSEAVAVAIAGGLIGLTILACLPSGKLAAGIAASSLLLYVLAYTPAKRCTVWNTLIGAIPGALPPLIGWASATGSLSRPAFPLFAILFCWQIPHFLAIAWIYRDQYRRAGLKMLSVNDATGSNTVVVMWISFALLALSSYWPLLEDSRWLYAAAATSVNGLFAWTIGRFCRNRAVNEARNVLRASILYLPTIFSFWVIDRYIT
jgi:protoheme IX farnesyltransferase